MGKFESNVAKSWAIGDEIIFKDFKSSSTTVRVAEDFMKKDYGDVIYEISNPKGIDICEISCFSTEGEVFFTSGSKFRVIDLTFQPRLTKDDQIIKVIELTLID